MSDLLGDGEVRVSWVRGRPTVPDTGSTEDPVLVTDESVSADLASVLPPRRLLFKVTTWPTGLIDVERVDD